MAYKKILIPTDSSELSIEASKKGIELAKLIGSEVHIIYVIDIVPFIGLPTEGLWESMKELLLEEGEDALNTIGDICEKEEVKYVKKILEGSPANEIINYAEDNEIDLIVLGTTGKTGLDKLLLGSVAEKVSKKAHCSVLLVKKHK